MTISNKIRLIIAEDLPDVATILYMNLKENNHSEIGNDTKGDKFTNDINLYSPPPLIIISAKFGDKSARKTFLSL